MIDTSKDMRWMTNNFLESGYGSFVVSSENASYPLENMLDGSQRTKLFKFGGRFLIEAGVNDKIYINATSFTVPADDYNSLDDLITAINALTEPLVTFSTSIPTGGEAPVVGVSDATAFTLKLSSTTAAIWETLGFTGSVDVAVSGAALEEADEARIHWPYEEITIDFGYQAEIGFIAMIGDLTNELRIPEGATITLQGNTVNSFVTPPLEVTIPWYKKGCFRFLDDQSDDAWRYVKIIIECPSGPFIPEIGFLYIGDYQRSGINNIGIGFEMAYVDRSEQSESSNGQIYTNSRCPYRAYQSMEIGLAKPAQAKFLKDLYALKQKSIPFFVALDPTQYLSSEFDEYLAYVRFPESPTYRHILRNYFQLSFELREAL